MGMLEDEITEFKRMQSRDRRIKELEGVLEQALDCIRGETPEDITHEEAREDTISKIRAVLLVR
jgi:hypothetical protein